MSRSSSQLSHLGSSRIINHIETPSPPSPLGPSLGRPPISITQSHVANKHIPNPKPKHHVQVPRSGSVPASNQIGRATVRVLELNGSSAHSHTDFVTLQGLMSHAREIARPFRQVFEAKVFQPGDVGAAGETISVTPPC